MAADTTYVAVGCRPWTHRVFEERLLSLPGVWRYVGSRDELSVERLAGWGPRYVFFLHWSWKVPSEITRSYECVLFHMTDVPYGRGGSPLQNLIVRGHRRTKLSAMRMTDAMDAGPVYLKEDLGLEGSAEEIFMRASAVAAGMVGRIVREDLAPKPQEGAVTVFRRRAPEESRIPRLDGLEGLYDFVRMLDAEGYPRAFLTHEGFRYEFSRAGLRDGRIVADVTITPLEKRP